MMSTEVPLFDILLGGVPVPDPISMLIFVRRLDTVPAKCL